MKRFNISLSPLFSQTLSADLIDGKYQFVFTWSVVNNGWVVSAYEGGKLIASGRVARLNQDIFGNLPMKGRLMIQGAVPTRLNLGIDCKLYYEVDDVSA